MAATSARGVGLAAPRGSTCRPRSGLLSAPPASTPGCSLAPSSRRRMCSVACSSEGPPRFEDFGARDPYPGELGSEFGERTLGLADTEHRILMPKALKSQEAECWGVLPAVAVSLLLCAGFSDVAGLSSRSCETLAADAEALEEGDARELLKRVVGWRLVPSPGGGLSLQGQWKVRDAASGKTLIERMEAVASREQQQPELQLDEENRNVTATLQTAALGGLSLNDFVLAAKIDLLDIKDLVPKAKFWA